MVSRLRKHLRLKFDRLFYRETRDLERVGSVSSWVIAPSLIPQEGVVISGGVGQDIGFEKALVTRFNCVVHLFDPSTTGVNTMSLRENCVAGISYSSVGLAGRAGTFEFAVPKDPAEGSFAVPVADSRPTVRY